MFKTAENFVRKHEREIAKAENHINLDDVLYVVGQNEDIDERLSFEEYSRQISDALTDHDAQLFRLRYIEKYSLDEIAQLLNTSVTTVGVRVFRLKKKLITILDNILPKE